MGTGEAPGRYGMALVRGASMLPTLRPGDRLLVRYGVPTVPGGLAIVRLPDGVVSVKRLELVDREGYWFTRDNPLEGLDSWSLGRASTPEEVLARVVCRVWPRPSLLRHRPVGG